MADKKVEATVENTEVASSNLPTLSKEGQKVLEMVEKMTVLELADVVKVMEDKFGVSAAAPVAVAAAPADGDDDAAAKSAFNVVLKDAGSNKIGVIKVVREITELGLMEAKKMVEEAPQTIKETVPKDEAEEMLAKFEEAGAKAELE